MQRRKLLIVSDEFVSQRSSIAYLNMNLSQDIRRVDAKKKKMNMRLFCTVLMKDSQAREHGSFQHRKAQECGVTLLGYNVPFNGDAAETEPSAEDVFTGPCNYYDISFGKKRFDVIISHYPITHKGAVNLQQTMFQDARLVFFCHEEIREEEEDFLPEGVTPSAVFSIGEDVYTANVQALSRYGSDLKHYQYTPTVPLEYLKNVQFPNNTELLSYIPPHMPDLDRRDHLAAVIQGYSDAVSVIAQQANPRIPRWSIVCPSEEYKRALQGQASAVDNMAERAITITFNRGLQEQNSDVLLKNLRRAKAMLVAPRKHLHHAPVEALYALAAGVPVVMELDQVICPYLCGLGDPSMLILRPDRDPRTAWGDKIKDLLGNQLDYNKCVASLRKAMLWDTRMAKSRYNFLNTLIGILSFELIKLGCEVHKNGQHDQDVTHELQKQLQTAFLMKDYIADKQIYSNMRQIDPDIMKIKSAWKPIKLIEKEGQFPVSGVEISDSRLVTSIVSHDTSETQRHIQESLPQMNRDFEHILGGPGKGFGFKWFWNGVKIRTSKCCCLL